MPSRHAAQTRLTAAAANVAAAVVLALATAGLGFTGTAEGEDSVVKSDEQVIVFPAAGAWNAERSLWVVPLRVWIYEPEENDLVRRRALRKLQQSLNLVLNDNEWQAFEARAKSFLVDNERGKPIRVTIGGHSITLPPTDPNGHATGELQWTAPQATGGASGAVPTDLRARVIARDGREFTGRVTLIPETGLSIISDIDDTIKVTEVRDRSALLRNTFLQDFAAVPGMSDLYRRWADEGAAFHYVSNSPWQLYEPLEELRSRSGFPAGTFHLRELRLKDRSFLEFLKNGTEAKRTTILSLLDRWPQRRFVLVGDSGEHDPEIYGEIARTHPEQVLQVVIRNVTNEPGNADRYQQAFRELPATSWQVFDDPGEVTLPDWQITPRPGLHPNL